VIILAVGLGIDAVFGAVDKAIRRRWGMLGSS
jgi:hypothetical protein